MSVVPTRRERLREATLAEIKDVARRFLVSEGPSAISLRAIAREIGMTAPGLYRYFGSREDLVDDLVADFFQELCGEMEHARDAEAADDLAGRLLAVSRAFRAWAVAHPAEFGLVFGTPMPAMGVPPPDGDDAGARFEGIFLELFVELWRRRPFPVPSAGEMDQSLLRQLRVFGDQTGAGLPVGAVMMFVTCWIRLYGVVAMEVFGHLRFCLEDAQPMFEQALEELSGMLGIASPSAPGQNPPRR